MASSISSLKSFINRPLNRHKVLTKHPSVVRSQVFKSDEGKSAKNIVDANLSVLRDKIEEVRTKERMEKYMMTKNIGWNNSTTNNSNNSSIIGWNKQKRNDHNHNHNHDGLAIMLWEYSLELLGLGSAAIGLAFLSGTLCIYLVSFIVHLTKLNYF
ncbi:uncharacterized protein LOC133821106 [Humulus lupulus]|uniref:uncharacterized protein LOC133821106 n=1 Tax=Humulus lupulus TaxID=3486 RepID=UPI002B4136ED|nr:uncharacterized protein LOC133821106 [Humulus lupulus]